MILHWHIKIYKTCWKIFYQKITHTLITRFLEINLGPTVVLSSPKNTTGRKNEQKRDPTQTNLTLPSSQGSTKEKHTLTSVHRHSFHINLPAWMRLWPNLPPPPQKSLMQLTSNNWHVTSKDLHSPSLKKNVAVELTGHCFYHTLALSLQGILSRIPTHQPQPLARSIWCSLVGHSRKFQKIYYFQ